MIRIIAILGFLLMLLHGASANPKPNVLFISIDDLNTWLGCMNGHPDVKTPNMDRLAGRGMLFTNAYCQFPLCGPSRASVMTGMLPTTLGFTTHMQDTELQQRAHDKGTLLLHEYFSENGYKTMAVGKICHQHVPAGSVDLSGGKGSFGPKLGLKWKEDNTSTDWGAWPETTVQTTDYKAADWTIDRLNEDHDKPFLLMTGFLRPHVPWYVPQEWFDKQVSSEEITLPPYKDNDWNDIPAFVDTVVRAPQYPTTEWAIENGEWRNIVQAYLACINFVDAQVGRILDTLDASPYADNTLVILWSDHGYHLGEKGLFKKTTLWERSTHVPLIIAGPGIMEVGVCERVVSLLDIYPTLLELCDLPENPKNEGLSLVPLLAKPGRVWDFPGISTLSDGNQSLTTEMYRYIRYKDGSEELYDRKADPNEWTNVATHETFLDVKRLLRSYLMNTDEEFFQWESVRRQGKRLSLRWTGEAKLQVSNSLDLHSWSDLESVQNEFEYSLGEGDQFFRLFPKY